MPLDADLFVRVVAACRLDMPEPVRAPATELALGLIAAMTHETPLKDAQILAEAVLGTGNPDLAVPMANALRSYHQRHESARFDRFVPWAGHPCPEAGTLVRAHAAMVPWVIHACHEEAKGIVLNLLLASDPNNSNDLGASLHALALVEDPEFWTIQEEVSAEAIAMGRLANIHQPLQPCHQQALDARLAHAIPAHVWVEKFHESLEGHKNPYLCIALLHMMTGNVTTIQALSNTPKLQGKTLSNHAIMETLAQLERSDAHPFDSQERERIVARCLGH